MSLLRQLKSGLFWSFLKQFSIQIVNFVIQIILARILLPSDFGLIAMIAIFVAIGQSLMDGGMTSSLIRFPIVKEIDYSTVFLSNVAVSSVVYIIVFICAPYIADFYNQEVLIDLIRVFSFTFVINSFNVVQLTKFTRELDFKKQFTYQFPSVLIGAIVGVYCAYSGFKVWSLVYLSVVQSLSFVIITWVFSDWRPKLAFSLKVLRPHFNYGYKLTLSGLIDTIYLNLYKILIGKYFQPAAVGYFSQADNLRMFPVNQMSSILDKVTFPVFSRIDNEDKLKKAFKSAMRLVLSVSSSLMISLIIIAKPLFIIILGEKWIPSIYYFQILCIASVMRPMGSYNLNILKVKGRSDLFLKIEVIKKIIGVAVIFASIPFGIVGLVWGLCLSNVFFAYFNSFFSGKFINYRFIEQLKDSLSILLLACIPVPLCVFVKSYIDVLYIQLLVIPLLYLIQYSFVTFFLNKELINDIKTFFK